jgi:hypothetical protein
MDQAAQRRLVLGNQRVAPFALKITNIQAR